MVEITSARGVALAGAASAGAERSDASARTRGSGRNGSQTAATQGTQLNTSPPLGKPKYFSPVVRVDNETKRAVLLFRDAESGEVERQFPTEEQLASYRTTGSSFSSSELAAIGSSKPETKEEEPAASEAGEDKQESKDETSVIV